MTSAPCPFCNLQGVNPRAVVKLLPGVAIFEPLNPVTPGHVLVVPVRHVPDAVADPNVTAVVMRAAAAFAGGWPAANIITSIGAAATQTVDHFHVHVVPRREGDGLALPWTGQAAA